MAEYDVTMHCTIKVRVRANSARNVRHAMREAFNATNASDPLAGTRFFFASPDYAQHPQIMTCVCDVPEADIEVEEI